MAFDLRPAGKGPTVREGQDFFKLGSLGHDLLQAALNPFQSKRHGKPPDFASPCYT
jgi:hypothetical protein